MFSGKSLAVFLLVGPLIGALSTGDTFKGGMPFILIPIYIFGGFFAAITWVIYSAIYSLLHEASFKHQIIDKVFFDSFSFFWSAFFAAVAGYASFTFFTCATASSIMGGPAKCAFHVLQNEWGMTFIPGAICGFIGTIFLEDERFVRR
ncbi:hypothetical protein [Ectopseudomonas toyotomiensis]|uniref:hypothetical protein n=1 Tax=Ectopseudomonas toyotomiensis TaxID=554344 RepID=UPI00126035C5|nr:hypothetical protein [Pseudomonas sp. LPH1]